ncbi:MAG: hypothetical protein JXO22_10885 [Phycisphaerae bacterium]|nr:hypothetical protein [Phycisphaerae bacterium]
MSGVFFYAAILKIVAPGAFAENIASYDVFPGDYTGLMALTIPWVEIIAAALLLAGRTRHAARLFLFVLLAAFTVLKVYALAEGHDLVCGCFGDGYLGRMTVGWRGLWLNVGLLACLVIDHCSAGRRSPAAGIIGG